MHPPLFFVLVFILLFLDAGLTWFALERGAIELNPLIEFVMDKGGIEMLFVLKGIFFVLITSVSLILWSLLNSISPGLAEHKIRRLWGNFTLIILVVLSFPVIWNIIQNLRFR